MKSKGSPPRHRQPANTPQAAQHRYTDYLQRSLACISKTVWSCSAPIRSSGDQALLTFPNEDAITLKTEDGGRVRLFAAQRFMIVPDPNYEDEYKTSTREYIYHVFDGTDDEPPKIQWHWHPLRQVPVAHIHAAFGEGINAFGKEASSLHIPSGRVAFEDVVRVLIEELGVVAKIEDSQAVLDDAMTAFVEHRTWSGSAPEEGASAEEIDAVQKPKRSRRARRRTTPA